MSRLDGVAGGNYVEQPIGNPGAAAVRPAPRLNAPDAQPPIEQLQGTTDATRNSLLRDVTARQSPPPRISIFMSKSHNRRMKLCPAAPRDKSPVRGRPPCGSPGEFGGSGAVHDDAGITVQTVIGLKCSSSSGDACEVQVVRVSSQIGCSQPESPLPGTKKGYPPLPRCAD